MHQQKDYLFFLLCISLAGCSSMIDFKSENTFKPRIRAFSKAIRWSQFEKAQTFIRLRNNRLSNPDQDYLKQIKVTRYEPLSELTMENKDSQVMDKMAIYTLEFYHKGNLKIERLQYKQIWWYDETIGTWFLDSELPTFN